MRKSFLVGAALCASVLFGGCGEKMVSDEELLAEQRAALVEEDETEGVATRANASNGGWMAGRTTRHRSRGFRFRERTTL